MLLPIVERDALLEVLERRGKLPEIIQRLPQGAMRFQQEFGILDAFSQVEALLGHAARLWYFRSQQGENPKVVQERLGHSNPAFTLAVYSHVLPGMQNDAARRLEERLLGRLADSENSRE